MISLVAIAAGLHALGREAWRKWIELQFIGIVGSIIAANEVNKWRVKRVSTRA